VRAIAADPQIGSVAARINLAQILAQRARNSGAGGERDRLLGQALNHLRAVLALDGNNLQAYATMCYIYYDIPLPDAAILIGRQAIKRADEIATGKFEDEVMAETVNRDKAAVKRTKGGKKDDKDDGPKTAKEVTTQGTGWTPEMRKHIAIVHNTMGLISLNKKSIKDAIPSFKKAVELNPELYEARLNLAAVSLRFRDYVTAEENFRAVVGAQPRNYEAIIGLGVALRGNRKFDEAEAQYNAAQKLDPSRGDSYFNLGLLYQEYKGSEKPTLQKAQGYYRDYIQRSSSNATKMRRDAEKRIKDIDELFVALAEAAKLQAEAEEIQRKSEEQQKKMEEEMKRQDEAAKKAGAAPDTAAPPAAPANDKTQPPPAPVTPPPPK
jgi:tetratricopeptide (TPR) repeat protein